MEYLDLWLNSYGNMTRLQERLPDKGNSVTTLYIRYKYSAYPKEYIHE